MFNLPAKFEVSSFNCSTRDIEEDIAILKPFKGDFGPKFGWVTWPVNNSAAAVGPISITRPQITYTLYNFHCMTTDD